MVINLLGYNYINIRRIFYLGIRKNSCKKRLIFYFISDPSVLFDNTQCIQFQSKEVYERNLILTHLFWCIRSKWPTLSCRRWYVFSWLVTLLHRDVKGRNLMNISFLNEFSIYVLFVNWNDITSIIIKLKIKKNI